MLVPIIFLAALMLTLAGALLESSILAAKSAQSAAVAQYSGAAIADGVADFTHGLAAYVARHGTDGPWPQSPSQSAIRSACATTVPACPFRYIISAAISAASHPGEADGANAAGGGTDAALNVQAAGIDEQRVSARVTTRIIGPNGYLLGSRTRFLTYRVFSTAPYAVITGSRDAATIDGEQSAAQGDSGGTPALTPEGQQTPTGFVDTRIHVRLRCATVIKDVVPFVNDQQRDGNDGLPWGDATAAAYEAPCASADAPADLFRDERWNNGDTNASGWTP